MGNVAIRADGLSKHYRMGAEPFSITPSAII